MRRGTVEARNLLADGVAGRPNAPKILLNENHHEAYVGSRKLSLMTTEGPKRAAAKGKRTWLKRALLGLVGLPFLLLGILVLSDLEGFKRMGGTASGARLQRIQQSSHWKNGKFQDVLPRQDPEMLAAAKAWFFEGSDHRIPAQKPPVVKRVRGDYQSHPASGLRVTWLGHSSFIVEIEKKRLLVDPLWGPNAAPFTFLGVDRFVPPPLPFDELPPIDAVLISHDHYDHLDYPTIQLLKETKIPFLVPLGVGAHLTHWGIPESRIHELEWWDEFQLGKLRLISTPARHFSGRSFTDREQTFWTGWAMIGEERRAYYTGDTAMFPGFTEIGEKLGPFDVTLVESGAYNKLWVDVHLGPEQAVAAHQMLRGELMIPVHWGLFDLALHSWIEPMERVLVAAQAKGVRVASPKIGEMVDVGSPPPMARWWEEVPWGTAQEAPAISHHLPAAVVKQIFPH